MAGNPVADGCPKRTRQRRAAADNRRVEHTGRWASATTPAQRLMALADTARSLTAGRDRYGDHDAINDLLDQHTAALHRELRKALDRRRRR